MSRRASALTQADYDQAVNALKKAGFDPEIIFDLPSERITVRPKIAAIKGKSNWQAKAPDRV